MSKRKPTLRTTAKIKIVKPKMVTYRMIKPPHWVLATDGAGFYLVLSDTGAIGIIPATMAYELMKDGAYAFNPTRPTRLVEKPTE